MKALKITTLFFCLFFLQAFSFAQNLTHYREREAGFWNIGINVGSAYQTSTDVYAQYNGFGAGLTLGKNMYYRPGAFFAFDIRGSALYAQSYGLDASRAYGVKNNLALNGVGRSFDADKLNYSKPASIGYYFANYKTQNGSLDLEGVLRFNRLRERTGIVLSLFGGVGFDLYQAKINQKSGNDSYAAKYQTVDSSDYGTAHIQLKNILDDSYETIADGNKKGGTLTWMPTAGIELGYQFAPRYHVSIFHKINFTRSDVFDGQQWSDFNSATDENDWQHYTGLKFEWEIGSDKKGGRPPRIEVLAPDRSPYFTKNRNVRVSATIRNINNAADVQYRLNGVETDFNFYNPRLNSDIVLRPGRNEVEIVATNPFGSDKKVIVIITDEERAPQNEPQTQPNPLPQPTPTPQTQPNPLPQPTPKMERPIVNITYPSRSPFTTNEENIRLDATILNVKNENDVRFFVNGRERTFSFNSYNKTFNANVRLNEGKNEISLEGTNSAGRDEATGLIIFERPRPQIPPQTPTIQRPSVSINSPYNGQVFRTPNTNLEARALNVSGKNDISVYLNNSLIDFNFNTLTKKITSDITLREGANTILVQGNNSAGTDKASVTVNYQVEKPLVYPPTVNINSPNNGTITEKDNTQVTAKVQNIATKNQVVITVNGKRLPDFSMNSYGDVTFSTRLQEGANTILVIAENESGKADAAVLVTYRKPVPPTPTDRTPRNPRTPTEDGGVIINPRNPRTPRTETPKDDAPNTGRVPRTETPKNDAPTTGRNPRTPRTETPQENPKPIITITSVSQSVGDPTQPASGGCTVLATLKNVTDKNQVNFTVNGKVTTFDFDLISGGVTANFSSDFYLEKGENTIILKVTTDAGSAEESRKVTF